MSGKGTDTGNETPVLLAGRSSTDANPHAGVAGLPPLRAVVSVKKTYSYTLAGWRLALVGAYLLVCVIDTTARLLAWVFG